MPSDTSHRCSSFGWNWIRNTVFFFYFDAFVIQLNMRKMTLCRCQCVSIWIKYKKGLAFATVLLTASKYPYHARGITMTHKNKIVNSNHARTKLSPVNVLIEFHLFIQMKATSIQLLMNELLGYSWAEWHSTAFCGTWIAGISQGISFFILRLHHT